MNNLIKRNCFRKVLAFVLLSFAFFIVPALVCKAIDPRKHQMEIQALGATTNGMQLNFAVDKKELTDSAAQYVTVEFIVENTTTSKRTIAELGSHKGVFFFAKANNGSEQEMLGVSSGQGLSTFIHNVAPGSSLGIYLRLKKADLQNLAEAEAWGEVTVREGEESATVAIVPFKLQVAIILPH